MAKTHLLNFWRRNDEYYLENSYDVWVCRAGLSKLFRRNIKAPTLTIQVKGVRPRCFREYEEVYLCLTENHSYISEIQCEGRVFVLGWRASRDILDWLKNRNFDVQKPMWIKCYENKA